MAVGFFPDVDWLFRRDDVCPMQQSSCVELAWLPVWPQALGFRVILIGLYKLIKIDRRNRDAAYQGEAMPLTARPRCYNSDGAGMPVAGPNGSKFVTVVLQFLEALQQ